MGEVVELFVTKYVGHVVAVDGVILCHWFDQLDEAMEQIRGALDSGLALAGSVALSQLPHDAAALVTRDPTRDIPVDVRKQQLMFFRTCKA